MKQVLYDMLRQILVISAEGASGATDPVAACERVHRCIMEVMANTPFQVLERDWSDHHIEVDRKKADT